jgi:hypothetical protein
MASSTQGKMFTIASDQEEPDVSMPSFACSCIVHICVWAQQGGSRDSMRRGGASIMQMGQSNNSMGTGVDRDLHPACPWLPLQVRVSYLKE